MDHTQCKQHAQQNQRPSQGPRKSYWPLCRQLFASLLSTSGIRKKIAKRAKGWCWRTSPSGQSTQRTNTKWTEINKRIHTELTNLRGETKKLQAEAAQVQQTIADSVANKPEKLSWPILMLSRCGWRRGSSATPTAATANLRLPLPKYLGRATACLGTPSGLVALRAHLALLAAMPVSHSSKLGTRPSLVASVVHVQEHRLSRSVIPDASTSPAASGYKSFAPRQ